MRSPTGVMLQWDFVLYWIIVLYEMQCKITMYFLLAELNNVIWKWHCKHVWHEYGGWRRDLYPWWGEEGCLSVFKLRWTMMVKGQIWSAKTKSLRLLFKLSVRVYLPPPKLKLRSSWPFWVLFLNRPLKYLEVLWTYGNLGKLRLTQNCYYLSGMVQLV